MRAVFIRNFGSTDVLEVGEFPKPVPQSRQVLIQVVAASVNPRDWMIRRGTYPLTFTLPRFPFVLGSDVAGVVAQVGKGVTQFKEGDEVYAMQPAFGGFGAYAEYMAIKASAVGKKPKNMSFEEAAAVPCAGQTAWQALLKLGHLQKDQRITIVGASGSVGSFAVQIARFLGAGVTGVCSGRNADLVKSLGAEEVLDYRKVKFSGMVREQDLVFDTLGKESLGSVGKVLKPRGIYISTVPSRRHLWDSLRTAIWPLGQKSKIIAVRARGSDLNQIGELIEAGEVRAVIDKIYSLDQVAEAHQYSQTFHTQGKLILKVRSP